MRLAGRKAQSVLKMLSSRLEESCRHRPANPDWLFFQERCLAHNLGEAINFIRAQLCESALLMTSHRAFAISLAHPPLAAFVSSFEHPKIFKLSHSPLVTLFSRCEKRSSQRKRRQRRLEKGRSTGAADARVMHRNPSPSQSMRDMRFCGFAHTCKECAERLSASAGVCLFAEDGVHIAILRRRGIAAGQAVDLEKNAETRTGSRRLNALIVAENFVLHILIGDRRPLEDQPEAASNRRSVDRNDRIGTQIRAINDDIARFHPFDSRPRKIEIERSRKRPHIQKIRAAEGLNDLIEKLADVDHEPHTYQVPTSLYIREALPRCRRRADNRMLFSRQRASRTIIFFVHRIHVKPTTRVAQIRIAVSRIPLPLEPREDRGGILLFPGRKIRPAEIIAWAESLLQQSLDDL